MSAFARRAVCVSAVLLVGLLAGLLWGTGMDAYTQRGLAAAAWISQHQANDALFRKVLPLYWNLTTLLLIVASVITRGRAKWLFGAAAVLMIFSLLITLSVEVPMNRQIAVWDPNAAPADWADIRERWLLFHLCRMLAGMAAFVCALLGLAGWTAPPNFSEP